MSPSRTIQLGDGRASLLVSTDSTVQNVSYTYDALNRLATVSESGQQQAAYAYDTNGNRARLTYRYNKANRLLSENRTSDGGSETLYTYDADGIAGAT